MEKKCPHCNEWTSWNGAYTDTCEHCKNQLEPRFVAELEAWRKRESGYKRSEFYTITESDGPFMIATRKVALFFHIVFGAIAWFFIWTFVNVAA